MEVRAADYSYARPDLLALYAAGYRIVLRYLGTDNRCINRAELARLHDYGFMVAVIAEDRPAAALDGWFGGQAFARKYNTLADQLGAPGWLPIFYAVDFDVTAAQMPAVLDWFRGVLEVPGRPVGAYGKYSVVEALADLSHNGRRVEHLWQCAAWSGAGTGTGGSIQSGYSTPTRLSDKACLFQHYGMTGAFGGSIDHNEVMNGPPDWAWHPTITVTPHLKEMVMANGVKLPDIPESGGTVWLPTTDGVGRPRRVALAFPHGTSAALEAGVIDGVVELTGDVGREFWNYWIEAAPVVDEWQEAGANLANREQLAAAVTAAIDAKLAGVEVTGLPTTFADDVAEELAARLAN